MTFDEIYDRTRGVEGWMTQAQARALHDAAAACPPGGTIVEIGSFQGRSTIVLASAAPAGVRLYAIDPHAGNDRGPQEIDGFAAEAQGDNLAFEANLAAAGVRDRITHLRAFASDVISDVAGPVDVLYVDGAHRFAPARADIRDWGQKVRDGGTMLVHDSFSSIGVTAALMAEMATSSRWRYAGRSRSLATYCADLRRTPAARIANTARHVAQLPWFAKNLLLKALLVAGLGKILRRLGRPVPEWPY